MFLQQLNTLATLFVTKWVNTGDKILDSSLVAIFVMIVSAFLFHVVERWKDYYNFVVFYLYGMYKDPLALRNTPYIMECVFENNTEFMDKTRGSMCSLHISEFNDKLKNHKIILSHEDVRDYVYRYVESNNLPKVLDKQGRNLGIYYDSKTFPIAVGRYGSLVYFETMYFELRSRGFGDRDTSYIKKYLIDYIVDQAIKDKTSVTCEDIYVPTYVRKEQHRDNEHELEMKSIGKINKKKNFDALYYPQKSELIALLSRFQSGTMYPPHIPMDNKLGILLYGPPGTGKTGTISAVANMLRRSLLVINFANITTCKQLDEIMDPTRHAKFVYVFDEFDCVLDVINAAGGGKKENKHEQKMDWGSALLFADEAERKNILTMMKEGRARKDDTPIDMAYLLQKLDGLESAEGRVIIATTNNPDKINPALLRPGRFDIKICLGPATESMIVDILTNFFQGDEELRSRVAAARLPGGAFTPLELINAAIQTPDCEKLLTKLVDLCKDSKL